MPKQKKYYVVWKGRKTGVFDNWGDCQKSIDGFSGPLYKSFINKGLAERAFRGDPYDYLGRKSTFKEIVETLSEADKKRYGVPIGESIAVDGACSGSSSYSPMEYRGVFTASGKEIFISDVYEGGTNNIAEFLAIVHALALMQKNELKPMPIYSDSITAMGQIKKKKCRTKVKLEEVNPQLHDAVKRAEKWLENNEVTVPIKKWHTRVWGEIPADFGHK